MKWSALRILAVGLTLSLVLSAHAAPAQQVSGTLSFLSWYTQDSYQPLLDAFQAQYPDVQFDFQNVPPANNQYNQRLQLLASSGELPDLFYVQPPSTLLAQNGYLADISDLDVVKALPAGYTEYYTYDGKVYAYAPDAWVGGVFYNKTLFADNNVAVPETWDDFLAAAKTFNDMGIKPISMGADELPDLIYWLHNTKVLSQDPSFDTKINTGETTFTEGYLDAFNTWKTEMVDTGYISLDMVGLTDDQRMTEFATGEAAMTISGPWAVSGLMDKNPDLDLGIFPFVGTEPDNAYTVGAVNVGVAISAQAQNQAAAEAFINFLGSDDGLKIYQSITGNFLGTENVDYTINPVMEPMRTFAANGKFAFPPVFWTNTGTLADMLVKGTQEIVLGVTTPEELVAELDAKQAELSGS
jgi:raffinose/stachyose/melibiose transport system substrate-binding protein